MTKNRHVALLRGINVGENNIIKMQLLRESFEAMGLSEVITYIQSGNVVFSAGTSNKVKLGKQIEAGLSEAFGYESKVVLLTAEELHRVVADAPAGFGTEPERYRYDVLFVRHPMTALEAFEHIPRNVGVDDADAGTHALYFRRLIAKAAQSHLEKLARRPVYKHLTVRNWNTTIKLRAMVS